MVVSTRISASAISTNTPYWDEVRLPAPVFEGDTLYAQSAVIALRQSKSRPAQGLVTVKTSGFNQDGVVVIEFQRTILVYKRGQGPVRTRPVVRG